MLPMIRRNSWLASPSDDVFGRMRSDLDSVFDRVFGTDGGFTPQAWSSAPFTIWEDDDRYHIEVDLPGVVESELEVTVHNGMLFIRGERKPVEGVNYLYNSRAFGRFERVVSLPSTVATSEVEARLRNGVLRIELTKSPESKPKKISIEVS